jgi:peptide deformylase
MAVRPVLLLGDPLLWQRAAPFPIPGMPGQHAGSLTPARSLGTPDSQVRREITRLHTDLRDTLLSLRRRRVDARAIAAPQIGVPQRVIYIHEPGPPTLLVNPVMRTGGDTVSAWENCLSLPGLSVKTRRASSCIVSYLDENLEQRNCTVTGDLAILMQHECDHLDGILCLERACDAHSFFMSVNGRVPPGLSPVRTE